MTHGAGMNYREDLHVFENSEIATDHLLAWWQAKTLAFSQAHRPVSWALSGGKTPLGFYKKLAQSSSFDWKQLQVFLVDERDVDEDHPDSNYRACYSSGLGEKLSSSQFPPMRESALDQKLPLSYEAALSKLPESRLDLVLLGMGADGHTASLFPGTQEADKKLETPFSPKDPLVICHELPNQPLSSLSSKWRVTLSYRAFIEAREVVLLVMGQDKAKRLHEIFHTDSQVPCAKLWKLRKQLGLATSWYLDSASASMLE